MKVLVACEFSGTVRDAFAARGHDAWSCDLEPSECPGQHYQGNALDILDAGWDILIAHPPCTVLSYAGNAHWNLPGREALREEAMNLFMAFYNAPVPRVCVENPVGYPIRVFRKADQIVHPYYFGDPKCKRTCLWLRGLPKLSYQLQDDLFGPRTATDFPKPVYATLREDGSVKLRHVTEALHGGDLERSRTSPALAAAMAEQWSNLGKVV